MSPVHKLSQMGSLTTNKTDYPSMLAGYGDFGALQRIGYQSLSNSTTASVTFSNIPATFQDLVVVIFAGATGASSMTLRLNGDGGNNYSTTVLYGNGSSALSTRYTSQAAMYANYNGIPSATSVYGAFTFNILNYANSSTNKTLLMRTAADANGSGWTELCVGRWAGTAAVNSLSIFAGAFYTSGSTFALYGVRASAT